MKKPARKLIKKARVILPDILLSPLTLLMCLWLKRVRKAGINNTPATRAILNRVGIFPIRDHFYEPIVDRQTLSRDFSQSRQIQGIDWNEAGQLELLNAFDYQLELGALPRERSNEREYFYNNGNFEAGDGGFLYSIIRHKKPKKIIEIGSGYSTLMALKAIEQNKKLEDHDCDLICIEPYRQKWLEDLPVKTIRSKVEELELSFFQQLDEGDILFIDSSHMIRPQGDVLFEYLSILPSLKKGVLVHVHDIFSPHDYPNNWIIDGDAFWNEQYLLEAFLVFNHTFKIIGAVNFLKIHHQQEVLKKIPLSKGGGSFWMHKVS